MKAALIIDIQNDYFTGGKAEPAGPVQTAKNSASVLRRFRKRNLPAIHVQNIDILVGGALSGRFDDVIAAEERVL
jgi:nicotinamidase-related amidase